MAAGMQIRLGVPLGPGRSPREKMKPCCSKHCLFFSPGPKVNFSRESQIGPVVSFFPGSGGAAGLISQMDT